MNKATLVKGVSLVAAMVMMGAGCSGSGSVDTQQPSGGAGADVNVGGGY